MPLVSKSAASFRQQTASLPPRSAGYFSHFRDRKPGVKVYLESKDEKKGMRAQAFTKTYDNPQELKLTKVVSPFFATETKRLDCT